MSDLTEFLKANKDVEIQICYPGDRARIKTKAIRPITETDEALLEFLFASYNHGSGQECGLFLTRNMRSMSVNDCVCIRNQWYQCLSVGWKKVSPEFVSFLEQEVVRHTLFTIHGAWFCLQDVMRAHSSED